MKNKCKFLLSVSLVIMFLFYKADFILAMAAEQNVNFVAGPEAERSGESTGDPEAQPDLTEEPASDSEAQPDLTEEPASDPEAQPDLNGESAGDPEAQPDLTKEPASDPEAQLDMADCSEPLLDSTQEPDYAEGQAAETEPGPDTGMEPEQAETLSVDPEACMESAAEPCQGESVSTGPALAEWLESHKNIGGTVRLTDNVVLDGMYSYCPSGINMPSVFVDTGIYTITITGESEILSDGHLTFLGRPEGKGIFYVAPGGALSMAGVIIESGQCAVWQEEGAGFVEENCQISGSVHYADMPFVIDQNAQCIVVEKGQTLCDVLPAQISCSVNRQGQVSHNEPVLLSWHQEGTERQQKERRRFQLQGSFLHAASAQPPRCTVVYNDYPLTFAEVNASVSGNMYLFRGWFTKTEGVMPATIISEYSFDGENWFISDEIKVKNAEAGFFIAVSTEPYDAATPPDIYIRLQGDADGTPYFSNVLHYTAGNLDYAEDIGGSRGGGTSIVNPPDKPQESPGDATPSVSEADASNTDAGQAANEVSLDASDGRAAVAGPQTDAGGQEVSAEPEAEADGQAAFAGPEAVDDTQAADAEFRMAGERQSSHVEIKAADSGQPPYTEPKPVSDEQPSNAEPENDNDVTNDSERKESDNRSAVFPQVREQVPRADIWWESQVMIAAGAVLLSVAAGIVGVFFHSRSGTKR